MKTIFRKFLLLITIVITLTACTTQNSLADIDEVTEGILLPQDPSIISGKLENGMDYYIQKNSTPYNRISLRLVVKVGSIAENENEKGLAHFVEHMCFNGTEHFEKNSLIDYAESIGMDFGAEVNAYTSFEETVYKLEIPADQGEFLENALLILHDWASSVTFDEEELEKERGVITEEWRGSLGLSNRRIETLLPFELKDSPYVDRLPIGDMAVIQNVSRDEILAFYKRWYRPENMAVIITGCVDPQVAEYLVKETMGTIPASEESISVPKGFVPAREEKDLIVFKDVEMPYIQVQLLSQNMNAKAITREEDIKQGYITDIARSVLSMRLSEISQSVDAPWLFSDALYTQETHTAAFNCLAFIPKDGMFESSFKKLLDELDRLLTYGITQSELERTIKTFLVSEEQWYEQRESISSQDRAEILCNHVISGDTVVSDEVYFDIAKRILASITLEDVNAAAQDMFADRGKLCMIDAPEGTELPQREELMDLWENYVSEGELTAYEDLAAEDNLMEKPEEKAEVVSTRHLETLEANEYLLSNGARIIVKKTDFEKAKIYMTAESQGGTSLVSDDEYPSCILSPNYALFSGISGMNFSQLQKFLSDSYINLDIAVNDHEEMIYTESKQETLEKMMQLMNRLMVAPQFTEEGWNYINILADQTAKTSDLTPSDKLLSRVREILYGNSIRHKGITKEFVEKLDKDTSEKCYRERFSNAADFTFTFVGDLDEEALVDLCCYYIGTIPGDESKRETPIYEKTSFPSGITQDTVKTGQENKGQVFLAFGGSLPPSKDIYETWKDLDMMEELRSLVDIKLREIIREDKGGTYGVSVMSEIDGYPERTYKFQITFGCEPTREKELVGEVLAAINKLRTELVDNSYIDKLQESFRRGLEVNRKTNSWWVNMINAVEVFKYLPAEVIYDDTSIKLWVTAEAMKDLAVKYLDTNNYVCVYLEPEDL